MPEGCPEVIVKESPDELTLRAEEVGTLKARINVDHIEKERWGHPLVDCDWCAKEMSRVVGERSRKRPRKQKPSGK